MIRRLRTATKGRLTVVVGPAGAGKSILVKQWSAGEIGRPVAWARAGSAIVDGVTFSRELLSALASQWGEDVLFEATRRVDVGGERMGTTFLGALLEAGSGCPPTTLVVEDVHRLSPHLWEELVWMVENAPADLRFLFTSRSELPGLHRLRGRGDLTQVGPLDLSMDREESALLVERVAGKELCPDEVDTLWQRTEGWPVGVQLAAVAIRDRPLGMSVTEAMARIDRHVGDYLDAEVIDHQPIEVRAFLRLTAVLDELCGSLCDVITGRSDGQQMLLELERRALVTPLDSNESWFRYHPLVTETMRRKLRADDPDLFRSTLKRASDWYLERDQLESAVTCLVEAEAWQDILDLVSLHGWTAYERGEGAAAIRWLRAVPPPLLRAHRQASFAMVVIERFVGNAATAEALLDDLETRYRVGTRERAGLDIIRATGVFWGYPPGKALARLESALEVIASGVQFEDPVPDDERSEAFLYATARFTMGRALAHLGRIDDARAVYLEGLDDLAAYAPWRIILLGGLARVEVAAGRLGEAARTSGQALEIAHGIGLEDHVATAEAMLAAGQVASERGLLEEAEVLLGEAEVRARRNRRSNIVAAVVGAHARVLLARGDWERAGRLISDWKSDNDPAPPHDILHNLGALEAMVLLRSGEPDEARKVLMDLDHSPLTLGVAGQIALATRDSAALRGVLKAWPADCDLRGRVRHLLWQAIAAQQEGRMADATELLVASVAMAEPEGFVRLFLDAGPLAGEIVISIRTEDPSPFLKEVLERMVTRPEPEAGPMLLSTREMAVMRLLPTPLSNTDIAASLYISTNTLKTHLRRIYRKLEATSRLTAVERARELGII